jgi:hypothetical protein
VHQCLYKRCAQGPKYGTLPHCRLFTTFDVIPLHQKTSTTNWNKNVLHISAAHAAPAAAQVSKSSSPNSYKATRTPYVSADNEHTHLDIAHIKLITSATDGRCTLPGLSFSSRHRRSQCRHTYHIRIRANSPVARCTPWRHTQLTAVAAAAAAPNCKPRRFIA